VVSSQNEKNRVISCFDSSDNTCVEAAGGSSISCSSSVTTISGSCSSTYTDIISQCSGARVGGTNSSPIFGNLYLRKNSSKYSPYSFKLVCEAWGGTFQLSDTTYQGSSGVFAGSCSVSVLCVNYYNGENTSGCTSLNGNYNRSTYCATTDKSCKFTNANSTAYGVIYYSNSYSTTEAQSSCTTGFSGTFSSSPQTSIK
jgi:hypothetical protein